jgi:hypothetical protein
MIACPSGVQSEACSSRSADATKTSEPWAVQSFRSYWLAPCPIGRAPLKASALPSGRHDGSPRPSPSTTRLGAPPDAAIRQIDAFSPFLSSVVNAISLPSGDQRGFSSPIGLASLVLVSCASPEPSASDRYRSHWSPLRERE